MKKNLLRVTALLGLLATLAAVERAQGQSGTDRVLACLSQATDDFVQCVDEHAWYVAALCELRYSAEALLCAPHMVFTSNKASS